MSGPDVDHGHNANGNSDHAGGHRVVSARWTGPVRQSVFPIDSPGSTGNHARLAAARHRSHHSRHEPELLSGRRGSFAFRDERNGDDDALGIVMDDVQAVGPPVLLCFIEGAPAIALSGRSQAVRREAVLASLVRFFGPAAAEPLAYEDNDWLTEPWTHGYVGAMPPGAMTRYGHALREPAGRIHWAGAETSVEWQGYLEGALRSGVRAAREVAARHNA